MVSCLPFFMHTPVIYRVQRSMIIDMMKWSGTIAESITKEKPKKNMVSRDESVRLTPTISRKMR